MNFKIWGPLTSVPDELLNKMRLVHVFDREAFLITNDDEVFACGMNDTGCLGLEDTAPRFSPEPVVPLNGKRIKGFVFGGNSKNVFVVAYSYTGAVYMWGKDHGAGQTHPILQPTLMSPLTKKVIEVACGTDHCLLLNSNGEIFSWGGNKSGQLGINSKDPTETPTEIVGDLAYEYVTSISCGSYFSVAVTASGEVYTWGSNDSGQLGTNESEKKVYTTPERVDNLSGTIIKKIICGSSHVLAVSDVGELYVWGSNKCGELGLGDVASRFVPVKNAAVGRVTNIAASFKSSTSAARKENFKVLMWGQCSGLNIAEPQETLYESLHEVFAHFSQPYIMYKSVTRRPDYESVNETVKNAFGNEESSDLTVVAEGKKIFVHRTILRLRSDYFRALLQECWFSESDKCIQIDQSYDAMYLYLKYLYCGELKAEPKLALELLALADEYNDRLLKRLCEKTIQSGITIDNVASLYAISLKLDGKKLRKKCLSFAGNHVSQLIGTSGFDEWDLQTMKEFFRECRKRRLFRS